VVVVAAAAAAVMCACHCLIYINAFCFSCYTFYSGNYEWITTVYKR
jgi:hypothetical protein